ncbi:MAG TPA: hypothetical protein VND23_03775 [Acidimicrobiales bacterium]|nr:hypothetical protein [Acidimicrobiales bacterium]
MAKHPLRAGLLGAVVTAGTAVALPAAVASATTTAPPPAPASTPATGPHFTQQQQRLEQQLAFRVTTLGHLTADVDGSTTLSASDKTTLTTRLASETTAIGALVTKVPTDTTFAELKTDRSSMIEANRVYAVMVPQVFETIEADSVTSQVTALEANEAALQASVNSLSGQPGYARATHEYAAFVRLVNSAAADSAAVDSSVMAQIPQDYPGDRHVFVTASHKLLASELAIAHASYAEMVIGLATGGQTTS